MLDFDEINALGVQTEDELEDLLLMVYALGKGDASDVIGDDIITEAEDVWLVINERLADGKNWRERFPNKDMPRLVETECNRVYNAAVLNTAKASGLPLKKKWITMMDDKVRDTHEYLEGVAVPLDTKFYTFDGDSALYPGGFESPENNVNCRCYIGLENG